MAGVANGRDLGSLRPAAEHLPGVQEALDARNRQTLESQLLGPKLYFPTQKGTKRSFEDSDYGRISVDENDHLVFHAKH